MITIYRLFRRYFFTLTILIIVIQIIISIFIFLSTYKTIKSNTEALSYLSMVTLSNFEREVMIKMNRFNLIFSDIARQITRTKRYNIEYILDQLSKTENIDDFSIAFIAENGVIFDTNIREEKGFDLFALPDARARLIEAKETKLQYLDFPVYNEQLKKFYAYILKYIPEENVYLQIGYKIDILNELLERLSVFDRIKDYQYNLSIYSVTILENKVLYVLIQGEHRDEYINEMNNIVKSRIFQIQKHTVTDIKIANFLTLKDWSSPYGIFYVIHIKPNLYDVIYQMIVFNLLFGLIYLTLYMYYRFNIKNKFISPLHNITESIAESLPIVDDKPSEIREIEILKNSYKTHLENIKMRDLLKEVFIAQEKEREKIARELHDTILQDLNYLLLELSRNGMKNLADILKDDIRCLRSLIIESDIQKIKRYGLKRFLYELVEELRHKFPEINFKAEITQKDIHIDEEMRLILARITKELLLNAAKHSNGTEVDLYLDLFDDFLILKVKDNGVGFQIDEGFEKKGHLGLKLLRERVFILKGELLVNMKNGTEITIKVPID